MSLDFSLDLAIYAVFTLLITTATLWRSTWKSFKREQPRSRSLKLLLTAAASNFIREVVMIKVGHGGGFIFPGGFCFARPLSAENGGVGANFCFSPGDRDR